MEPRYQSVLERTTNVEKHVKVKHGRNFYT